MVRARVPMMCWLVIVAVLVIGPTANSEPVHLACEGAMRANEPRQERLDEKYLMSLVIDLSARTAKPEGHASVPLKGSVEDEDIVAFASRCPGWQAKPNNGRGPDPFPYRPNVRISWSVPPGRTAV
jgi:hypothetical protein